MGKQSHLNILTSALFAPFFVLRVEKDDPGRNGEGIGHKTCTQESADDNEFGVSGGNGAQELVVSNEPDHNGSSPRHRQVGEEEAPVQRGRFLSFTGEGPARNHKSSVEAKPCRRMLVKPGQKIHELSLYVERQNELLLQDDIFVVGDPFSRGWGILPFREKGSKRIDANRRLADGDVDGGVQDTTQPSHYPPPHRPPSAPVSYSILSPEAFTVAAEPDSTEGSLGVEQQSSISIIQRENKPLAQQKPIAFTEDSCVDETTPRDTQGPNAAGTSRVRAPDGFVNLEQRSSNSASGGNPKDRIRSEANNRSADEIAHKSTVSVAHCNGQIAQTDLSRNPDVQEHEPEHKGSTQEAESADGAESSDGVAAARAKSSPGITTTFYEHLWAKSNRHSTSTDAAVCGRKKSNKDHLDTSGGRGYNDNNRATWRRTADLPENGVDPATMPPSSPRQPSETPLHRTARVWRRPSVVGNVARNQNSIPQRSTVVDSEDGDTRSESRLSSVTSGNVAWSRRHSSVRSRMSSFVGAPVEPCGYDSTFQLIGRAALSKSSDESSSTETEL